MMRELSNRLAFSFAETNRTTRPQRKIITIILVAFFLVFIHHRAVAQIKQSVPPPVRQIDHIMIRSNDPSKLYAFFTETLRMPVAWPLATRGGVTSGGAAFGNANVEAIQFPEQKTSQTQLVGFGFEPSPLTDCLAELERRGVAHGEPRPFVMTEQDGSKKLLFTNITLKDFSDSDRPAGATIHIFLSEYSPTYVNVEERRERLQRELKHDGGGPLGVMNVKEVLVGAKDLAAATRQWSKLLEPPTTSAPGLWQVGNGPAIRLVRAEENLLQGLVISVVSLRQAETFLREIGMLGSVSKTEVTIDPSDIQGLNIRLVEDKY